MPRIRKYSKFAANQAVQILVARAVAKLISDNTELEADSLAVRIGSNIVGMEVADRTEQYTDLAVDKAVDFLASKRQAEITTQS